jgi:hypothetical protein
MFTITLSLPSIVGIEYLEFGLSAVPGPAHEVLGVLDMGWVSHGRIILGYRG